MSKKIIAILTIITILFVCVFAACEKKDKVYADSKDFDFVTDENGEKVLGKDGEFLVYATDEKGKYIKDENGEKETRRQQFEPIEEDGIIEDYGFKLKLPKMWKKTEEFGVFEDSSGKKSISIRVAEDTYDEYLKSTKELYGALFKEGLEGSIEEDRSFVKGAEEAFRLIVTTPEGRYVTVVALNAGNVYNVTLTTAIVDESNFDDVEEFLNGLDFKPFTYYPELTAQPSETASDTEEAK